MAGDSGTHKAGVTGRRVVEDGQKQSDGKKGEESGWEEGVEAKKEGNTSRVDQW